MSEITKTTSFGQIQITEFKTSSFQKAGTKTAVLKQKVVTTSVYPSVQTNDGLSASIIPQGAFGTDIAAGKSYSNEETRVFFQIIPLNYTQAQLQNDINNAEVAARAVGSQLRIVKRVSNNPMTLLTDNQKAAIKSGLKTIDDYAKSMVSRYGANSPQSGQLILDKNGNPQYRDMALSNNNTLIDSNTCGNGDIYIPQFIIDEMNGQTTTSSNVIFQDTETLKF